MPHVGGRYANLEWHDPRLEPVIEVYSEWGEFEWFLNEALERGYQVGFAAAIDQGRLLDVDGYAFDTPAEGITEVTDQTIHWRSVTTGDPDGVSFRIEATDEQARIDFRTPVIDREISLETIRRAPVILEAGGVDMKVVFEMEPSPSGVGHEALMTFQDTAAGTGLHPYWIRVVQTDGAKAWVSPFYVTIGG